ncbi:MAG TPA: hypothetical protein EYN91_14395 [Candidatus Melainabacteria bacterium]|jgi:uncharacterized membrane protein|nr:hypothetical protein [Candidatus Melainabacteria bacterium]HIN63304.1 hypothetical protein [Candidatus Obscuribacterales bacterium]
MPVINTGKFGGKGGGSNTDGLERIMAGLCYLTLGLAGLIYTIIQGRYARTTFFRFHFLQSILLAIMGILINMTAGIFANVVGGMLQLIPGASVEMIAWLPTAIGWVVQIGYLLLLYGLVFSLMGKEAEIPIVSKIVRQQLR